MDISFIIIMGSHLCFVIPKKYTMVFRILTFLLLPVICLAQINSNGEKPTGELLSNEVSPIEMKRKASFQLEELKVRWKKAALENCPGVPCVSVTVPGSPTIVNVVAGNAQATVSFTEPSSAGGSAITSYTVTSTPVGGTGLGTGSPLTVTGLSNGTSYTFTITATNAVGNSLASAASNAVTPVAACSAAAASSTPTLTVGTALTPNITHATTSATGIGSATGLPTGVTAAWSGNVITISGTPTVTGTFNYTIPLTGTSCSSLNATGTITASAPSFTCGTSTVSDIDLNAYATVSIGTQCWTKENLKVTKYNDGSAIPLNNTYTSGEVSTVWQGLTTGAYTIYGNESSTGANATNYGFLYNWYAVKGIFTTGVIASTDTLKICPLGWHVPTDAEWTTLVTYLNTVAPTGSVGGKMKSTSSLWNSPNTGADNSSGFSALPGGFRSSLGSFGSIRSYDYFWSASEYDSSNAWFRGLYNYLRNVDRYFLDKSVGASVRCLRD
jgi:uncharacterized protein (TIGR02145 family)